MPATDEQDVSQQPSSVGLDAFQEGRAKAARIDAEVNFDLVAGLGLDRRQECEPQNRLEEIVMHYRFEYCFGIIIMLNAIVIFVETEWSAQHVHQDRPAALTFLDWLFAAIFAIELSLRIAAKGRRFVTQGNFWTALDVFAVMSSVFELFMEIISSSMKGVHGEIRLLRLVRAARLLKALRIARLVRFVRALRTLLMQIAGALKSLVWSVLLLTLIIVLFATVFTEAVTGLRRDTPPGAPEDEVLMMYWGSLTKSSYTLFMAITGGTSWEVAVSSLSDVGAIPVACFLVYISFVQLALLNVLTGTFCQSAINSAAKEQDLITHAFLANQKAYMKELRKMFSSIDSDGSGVVTLAELEAAMKKDSMRAYLDDLELDADDVWTLFKLVDRDESNDIVLDEFIAACLRIKGTAKGIDLCRLIWDHSFMSKRISHFIDRTNESLHALQVSNQRLSLAQNAMQLSQMHFSEEPEHLKCCDTNFSGHLAPGAGGRRAGAKAPLSDDGGAAAGRPEWWPSDARCSSI